MATRADNRDGSCREILSGRHKGKWRVQYVFTTQTGQKRRLSRILSNKTEAKRLLQEFRRGTRVETVRSERELTLGEWLEWLAVNDWPETLAGQHV